MNTSQHSNRHETIYAWLMSAPALIVLLVFVALPLHGGINWSFTNKRLISPLPTEYIGSQNYWNLLGVQVIRLDPETDETTGKAQTDGGNAWRQFRHVTIPQLRNTTVFVIISTTILAFRLFTQVDVMTKGGPQDATVTVVFHTVDTGFRQQKIGYGSAVTVLFFIIVVSIALIQ